MGGMVTKIKNIRQSENKNFKGKKKEKKKNLKGNLGLKFITNLSTKSSTKSGKGSKKVRISSPGSQASSVKRSSSSSGTTKTGKSATEKSKSGIGSNKSNISGNPPPPIPPANASTQLPPPVKPLLMIRKTKSKSRKRKQPAEATGLETGRARLRASLEGARERVKAELMKIQLVNRFIAHHTRVLPVTQQEYIIPDEIPPAITEDLEAYNLFKEKLRGKGIELEDLRKPTTNTKFKRKKRKAKRLTKKSKAKFNNKMIKSLVYSSDGKIIKRLKISTAKWIKSQQELKNRPPWIKFIDSTNPYLKHEGNKRVWASGYGLNSKRLIAINEFEQRNVERILRDKYCNQKMSSCNYAKTLYNICDDTSPQSSSDEENQNCWSRSRMCDFCSDAEGDYCPDADESN